MKTAATDRGSWVRCCHGLRLWELLVVIAVMSFLAALLFPALATAKAHAQQKGCLSNLKQFGLAFQPYAGYQNDVILYNKDGPRATLGETWVVGWEGLPGPDCANLVYLQRSVVGPYLKAVGGWRCPSARDPSAAGATMARARTVSLNCFMDLPANVPGVTCHQRLGQVMPPSAPDALLFVDECIDTINDASFAMHPTLGLMKVKIGEKDRAGTGETFWMRCRDMKTEVHSPAISQPQTSDRPAPGVACEVCAIPWQHALRHYSQVCDIAASGVVVDLGVVWLLASPAMLE